VEGAGLKHYVITRTTEWRITAKDWEDALVRSKNPAKIDNSTVGMIEVETGREEQLDG